MNYRNCARKVFAALMICIPAASAQSVTVSYDQPPTVGIQFQELTFADAVDTCARMIVDGATQRLLSKGIDVSDRQQLRNVLLEPQFQAPGLRGIQVATALVVVKAPRCTYERDREKKKIRNYSKEKGSEDEYRYEYFATTSYYIDGSIGVIDASTRKVILTEPIRTSISETNKDDDGYPKYPPAAELEKRALQEAVDQVSAVLTTTRQEVKVRFFDDKSCGLKDGHRLVVGGDLEGALRFVQDSLESCKMTSAKKTKRLARAYHNVGVLQMMLNDHESAFQSLQSAVQLHDGRNIRRAFAFSRKAKESVAKAKQVEDRTREMNEQLLRAAQAAPSGSETPVATVPASPAAQDSDSLTDQLAERLRKLGVLFKQGLITEADYEAKKTEILSDL